LLAPKKQQELNISFTAQAANAVIATAIFKFTEGEELNKVLKFSAIGKYPFLEISQERIDFESLLVGQVEQ